MNITKNGASIIQDLIDKAAADGTMRAVVSGNYEIEKTVLLPSGFHLVLEDCYLVLKTGIFANMFTNENLRREIGRKEEGTDRNIRIEGRGNVVLDGGEYNGLSEWTSEKDGFPNISYNCMILFNNVDGFSVSGLHIRNQRWWGMCFLWSRNGKIRDIDFLSDYTWVDDDGVRHEGLDGVEYKRIYIKNSDGMDIRSGCHNIIIENITGFSEDDTVALTGLNGQIENMFSVEGMDTDIRNITVRNVMSTAKCGMVRLLNEDGIKLYNVLIDGVYDTSLHSKYIGRSDYGVRVGDMDMYGERHSTKDECFNITIKNVASRATNVLGLTGEMENITIENIKGFDGFERVLENNSNLDTDELLKKF